MRVENFLADPSHAEYLRNRLECAFLAGAKIAADRIDQFIATNGKE